MKKFIALLILIIAISLFGVAKFYEENKEKQSPLADWLIRANLDEPKTPEELYAAALNENMLVIYSTSTRMRDVVRSFERQYPGLIANVEHHREGELYDILRQNFETSNFAADVVCSADGRGIMTNEFLPEKIVVKYVPHDFADKILPGNNEDFLMLAGEASVLGYNEDYYAEPPIRHWWELTEERWRDMVYIPSPTRSMTTNAFFATVIQKSDMMAREYEDLYGVPLDLPPGGSAGREFLRRLIENGVTIMNSSDEMAEIIGAPGSISPYIGIVISSKTRLRTIGYELQNHYGMEPFVGVYTPINIMIAGGSKNINAARLFIRWVLGEADGQGEGYQPYLQSGAWSVRNDVRDETGMRSEELNLLHLDRVYLYENQESFLEFWEELLRSRR